MAWPTAAPLKAPVKKPATIPARPPMAVPTPGMMALPMAAPAVPPFAAAIPPVTAPMPPQAHVAIGFSLTFCEAQLGHDGLFMFFAPPMLKSAQAQYTLVRNGFVVVFLSELSRTIHFRLT